MRREQRGGAAILLGYVAISWFYLRHARQRGVGTWDLRNPQTS